MNITEEMVKAGADALEGTGVLAGSMWATGDDTAAVVAGAARAVAEAVAPLIAAQALRSAAGELGADGETVAGWLQVRAAALAACPTCTGQTRETVGMVCQTCGTDYAPGS